MVYNKAKLFVIYLNYLKDSTNDNRCNSIKLPILTCRSLIIVSLLYADNSCFSRSRLDVHVKQTHSCENQILCLQEKLLCAVDLGTVTKCLPIETSR